MKKVFCSQCAREFAGKKIRLSGKSVPAGVLPPCEWDKVNFTVDSHKYAAPCPTGWSKERVMRSYNFENDIAYSKRNTLASLLMCPGCGCWSHFSNGPNYKCDHCHRAWRKEYSPQRGRPPVSEWERSRVGSGSYKRRSKDLRWLK